MEKIKFSSPPGAFYRGLHAEVHSYLRAWTKGGYANGRFYYKALFFLAAFTFFYCWVLTTQSRILLFPVFVIMGFCLLLLGLNVAHDASHDSISRNKKLNRWLYRIGFALQGANGFFWQQRHLHEHHPFPNVPERDPDLLNVKWLRYSSVQPFKKYHRYQLVYAPLLYAVYTLYWIFIKDFSMSGTPVIRKKFTAMIALNILHKAAYLFVFLWLPVHCNQLGWMYNLAAFLLMHVCISLFLVFTFAISHYISGQPEAKVENGLIAGSWEIHQVASSVDFHVNSRWALFVFGGFNCHIAHHLFPTVSHVHYPVITNIIYRHLEQANIQPRNIGYLQGIRLHFKLLKEMANR